MTAEQWPTKQCRTRTYLHSSGHRREGSADSQGVTRTTTCRGGDRWPAECPILAHETDPYHAPKRVLDDRAAHRVRRLRARRHDLDPLGGRHPPSRPGPKAASILGADIEQAFAIAARQRQPVMMAVDRVKQDLLDHRSRDHDDRLPPRSFAKSGDYGVDSLYANRDTDRHHAERDRDQLDGPHAPHLDAAERCTPRRCAVSVGGMVRVNNR